MVRIVENSIGLPNALVRELARRARPRLTPTVELVLRPSRPTPTWPRAHRWRAETTLEAGLIEIELGSVRYWPYPFRHRHKAQDLARGYLSWGRIQSLEHCLLGLLAHELRHCWQTEWPERPWLSDNGHQRRGSWAGERDADLWALQVLGRVA